MKSSAVILLFISFVFLTNSSHYQKLPLDYLSNILNNSENFFGTINSKVENQLNKLFISIGLSEKFPKDPKVKLFLILHYDLKKIAEYVYEIYSKASNITAIEENGDPKSIYLNDIVTEIINGFVNDKTNKIQNKPAITHELRRNNNDENDKNYIKVILRRANEYDSDDSDGKYFTYSRSNLEAWEPSDMTESSESNITDMRRIFDGKKTRIARFPFVVSVHIGHTFACAGSIITRDLVITAASCLQLYYNNRFFRETPAAIHVRLGSDWISAHGELMQVMEIYFHPSYNPKTLAHNLALMRLDRELALVVQRHKKIRRIQLDSGDGNLAVNVREITLVGWGSSRKSQLLHEFNKIGVIHLDIYPPYLCKNYYSIAYVTENHFCAGFLTTAGGACNKDVGGPGVINGYLAGVVSFGPPVCGEPGPTVFTRVGHYIDWIEPIMEEVRTVKVGVRTTTTINPLDADHLFTRETTTNSPPNKPFTNPELRERSHKKYPQV